MNSFICARALRATLIGVAMSGSTTVARSEIKKRCDVLVNGKYSQRSRNAIKRLLRLAFLHYRLNRTETKCAEMERLAGGLL
jgi:hypothetical protein